MLETYVLMSNKYNSRPFINIKELKIISIIIYINYIDVKYYDFNIKKIAECKYVFFLHTYLYIRDHPYITSALFWTLSAQENFKPIYSFITVEWRANEELIVLNQKGNQRQINLKTFYKVIWTVIFHLIQNKPIITIKKKKIDIYVAGQNCATSSIKEIGVTLMKRDYMDCDFSFNPK